ncbi:MAG: bifunctional phosphoribosylaminoimidazolecarboxamide formyltransferase/IMP cyclohydrolase [Dehalococcoidia bacterium]
MDDLTLNALLSAYDKTGIADFARVLAAAGYGLVSTGGTLKAIQDAGLPVRQVSEVTGSPEILDGRVKTLHPKIHGGLLARRSSSSHVAQLEQHGIETVDVVVNNLYPFVETISRPDVTLEDALENIDIGGPAMTRAAAKNFPDVIVIVDPADYGWVGEMICRDGVPLEKRRQLAAKAFQHVALYDTMIAEYLRDSGAAESQADAKFPQELTMGWSRASIPRYGENPHQAGGVYSTPGEQGGVANARQVHGIDMSYLNYFDADAAWIAANSFDSHSVAIVKHANPCGLAVHGDQAEAYRRALSGDPVSAYGGIVGFNSIVTAETAQAMKGVLFDVIVAPGYETDALEILRGRKRTRLLEAGRSTPASLTVRSISGGVLAQTSDVLEEDPESWKVVTERKPSHDELLDLAFAWRACHLIRSNAIVLAKDRTLTGMGAGQPNRVTSVHLAVRAAGERASGSALASDAFFPFADGLELAGESGVTAVAQPGGSIRDDEVTEAANRLGMTMVFTGTRHFLH